MTSALAKYRENQKRLLDDASTGTQRPPRVSIKDNRFALIDPSNARIDVGPVLQVIFVDRNEKTSKLFWGEGKSYNPMELAPPVCWSDNGIAPSDMAQDPQSPTCVTCKWNAIGSAVGFKGGAIKACDDLKKAAVVVPGHAGVYMFEIKKGSFKYWNNYTSWLRMQKLPDGGQPDLSDVITEIKFVSVGTMSFEAVGLVEDKPELVDQVIAVWEHNKQGDLTGMMVGRYDQPAQGVLPAPQGGMGQLAGASAAGLAPAEQVTTSPQRIAKASETKQSPFAPPQQGEKNIFAKKEEKETKPARAKKDERAPIEPQPPHGLQTPQGSPPSDIGARLDSLFKLPTVK